MRHSTIVTAAAMFACIAVLTDSAHAIVIDKIAAVVNGEVITQREVTWLLIPIHEKYKEEYTGRRLEVKMDEARDAILKQLIEDKLIVSEAKRLGIAVTDKEIEEKISSLRKKFGTEEQLRDALAEQNVTLNELRERFEDEIKQSKLVQQEVGWKAATTPSEVREYYDTHAEEFVYPEKARVLNILIKKEHEGRTKSEAEFLIKKIKESAEKGDDFEELAKEYSQGPSAKDGGKLGFIEKGQMIGEIDSAIFALEVGGISDIVESPAGYHILKVTEKTPASVVEFEDAKETINGLIYRKKIEKNLKKWLTELKKNAYISIK